MPTLVVCAGCKQIFRAPLSFKKQKLPEIPGITQSGKSPRRDYNHECYICSICGYEGMTLTSCISDFKISRLLALGNYGLQLEIDLISTKKRLYFQCIEGKFNIFYP